MGIVDTPPTSMAPHVLKVESSMGIVILILNIIIPGLGTMLTACMAGDFNCTVLLIGILQNFLAYFIIGWIWSILHGIWVYNKSK